MRRLVVLGCSATKRDVSGTLPALELYDGPMYRVLRSYLKDHAWPKDLSVAVLSAEHGLMGGLTPISLYDNRMTRARAGELVGQVKQTLEAWKPEHTEVELVLGKDYLGAIKPAADALWNAGRQRHVKVAEGEIGMKLNYLKRSLRSGANDPAPKRSELPKAEGRPVYFLPDWDDFVDADFNFEADKFSSDDRASRNEVHCSALMGERKIADGILVSLAQSYGTKGLLRALQADSLNSLAPTAVKRHFKLRDDQWAFGDCGAFSYVNEEVPAITVEQAVATYELYGFDLGASVDHIPVPEIVRNDKRITLTKGAQAERVKITKMNAAAFHEEWRRREYRFSPVGTVQALSPEEYANNVIEYVEMGYRRIALGGLVPKSDDEIADVVRAVAKGIVKGIDRADRRPWIHLFGVYRPNLQPLFRRLGVDSFDSATYFRKAWLRSDQNYLGADGEWYAAIRVPPSHDPRTVKRLKESGIPMRQILALEEKALQSLRAFAAGTASVDRCLNAILRYDDLLFREESDARPLRAAYRRTLTDRPWEQCRCPVCKTVGIDTLIFRGLNRNKRRGSHNTLMLYKSLAPGAHEPQ